MKEKIYLFIVLVAVMSISGGCSKDSDPPFNNPEEPSIPVSMVADINPGPTGSSPTRLGTLTNLLYFDADEGANGKELWVYDPAQAVSGTNPKLLADLNVGGNSSPTEITAWNGLLYFTAISDTAGQEWFIYDPAQAVSGTNPLLVDFNSGPGGGGPQCVTIINNLLYFTANDGTGASGEFWVYDPSLALSVGTNPGMLADIFPGGGNSTPCNFTELNSLIYMKARGGTDAGFELWVYDPGQAVNVPTNPSLVVDLDLSPGVSSLKFDFIALNNRLYFRADDGNEDEMWVYDPAQAVSGTNPLLIDVNPIGDSFPRNFFVHNNLLYFSADGGGGNGSELWVLDPLQAISVGTNPKELADLNPGSGHSSPSQFQILNGRIIFKANGGANGSELWAFDPMEPVAAGTNPMEIADIQPGPGSSSPILRSSALNNRLYFSADDGTNGRELWVLIP